jgi:hypothetical protein
MINQDEGVLEFAVVLFIVGDACYEYELKWFEVGERFEE